MKIFVFFSLIYVSAFYKVESFTIYTIYKIMYIIYIIYAIYTHTHIYIYIAYIQYTNFLSISIFPDIPEKS